MIIRQNLVFKQCLQPLRISEFSTEFGGFQKINRFPSELKTFVANPPNFDIICMNIDALEDIINDESENKVQDTVHNALSNGEAGQDFYL